MPDPRRKGRARGWRGLDGVGQRMSGQGVTVPGTAAPRAVGQCRVIHSFATNLNGTP